MAYDLLIKGGHVLDPGQDLDAALDIAIAGGKIVKIAADIEPEDAARVIEVRGAGRHVVPGLIDLHTHVASGAVTKGVGMGSCDADDIGVRSGVTTVADCGSVGVANLGVFPAHILPEAKTRIITLVNAGSHAHTMPGAADVNSPGDINRDALAKAAEHNPGLIAGVKLRVVGQGPRGAADGPHRRFHRQGRGVGGPARRAHPVPAEVVRAGRHPDPPVHAELRPGT
jgi:dihydroorotase